MKKRRNKKDKNKQIVEKKNSRKENLRKKNLDQDLDENEQPEKNRKKHKSKNWKIVFILILIILIFFLIIYGISLYKWNKIVKDIFTCQNSVILDTSGNVIAQLGETRIQEYIRIDEISENFKNAYIAIEDKTFNKHHGINVRRTAGAALSYITNFGDAEYGGSTITQQLVKNITGENETKITRKVKEWDRAVKTEILYSKDEILEAYFNIIYVGPNIYGVKQGARYYFDKNVMDLSLAECAFMAGLNHSPNTYNPFSGKDNEDRIKQRTKVVLKEMHNQQLISEEDYNKAVQEVDDGLKFKKGNVEAKGDGVYSYLADSTINEVIQDLAEEKEISTDFATNYLYLGGLKIYSTQHSDIQNRIEEECKKSKYIIESTENEGATTQAAMIIIDHKNGHVVGCVGGLGEKQTYRGFNRATQALRQTGSAIKPIAVLEPALEENIITASTVYDDTKTVFANDYSPNNFEKELGNITVRRALESSQNIPFVKIMEQLTSQKSIEYMKKQGITSLTEKDNNLPLALGGLEKGISPLQMAGAYGSIANSGVYIEPIFYTTIQNSKGKKVLENNQIKTKVYSENTAYILKQLLTQPIQGTYGTAKMCAIDGMETAAKTGTTDNFYDKWLCGFTNHYTAVTWYGYDDSEEIKEEGTSMANYMWSSVMKDIHKNLIKVNFQKTGDIVEMNVCKKTGKIAGSKCRETYIEYYRKENVVSEICDE